MYYFILVQFLSLLATSPTILLIYFINLKIKLKVFWKVTCTWKYLWNWNAWNSYWPMTTLTKCDQPISLKCKHKCVYTARTSSRKSSAVRLPKSDGAQHPEYTKTERNLENRAAFKNWYNKHRQKGCQNLMSSTAVTRCSAPEGRVRLFLTTTHPCSFIRLCARGLGISFEKPTARPPDWT